MYCVHFSNRLTYSPSNGTPIRQQWTAASTARQSSDDGSLETFMYQSQALIYLGVTIASVAY